MTRRGRVVSIVLFALTFFSALLVGVDYAAAFYALPIEAQGSFWQQLAARPALLPWGLWYAVPLLAILLAHELGHFLACRRHGIEATWPVFLPAPTLIGTLGAFIRIRSPFPSKRALFDVGVAGPLAGFVVTVPVLVLGIALSRLGGTAGGDGAGLSLGEPLGFSLLARLLLGSAAEGAVWIHPTAFAGWFGLLATALNLFPVGQLDGGHLCYAVFGRKVAYVVSTLAVIGLILLGVFCWPGWLVWALMVTLIGLRHPWVYAEQRLDRRRLVLAGIALLVFVLSFTPVPLAAGWF